MIFIMLLVASGMLLVEFAVRAIIEAYRYRKQFRARVIGMKLEEFSGKYWLYMVDDKKQLIPTNSDQAPGLIVKNGIITGLF